MATRGKGSGGPPSGVPATRAPADRARDGALDETLQPSQPSGPSPSKQPTADPGASGADATIAAGSTPGGAPVGSDPGQTTRQGGAYRDLVPIDPAHYALQSELARGGMGRIMVARDRRLDRVVALKLLHGADPALRTRFEREARITAKLQHPAIVPVYEAGKFPDGEPFYSMKLVSGKPLDDVIAVAKTHAERLALLPNLIAVADALAYAHDRRIVHRDLKPQNVLVGKFGETMVIDWGLAKDLADTQSVEVHSAEAPRRGAPGGDGLTVDGAVMGTPAYMPPEQAAGNDVDERADVYSLGAMLYQLLAGVPPYVGKTGWDIVDQVIKRPPRAIEDCVPETPPDLIAIVCKAMARAADDRYPTAKELAEDLRRFQAGQLVGVHRYTAWQLLSRWVRRHRGAVAVGTAAALLLVVVGAVSLQRITNERREAIRQRNDARAQRIIAEEKTAEAEAQRRTADEQRTEADKRKLEAEEQRGFAQDRQREAEEQRVLAETKQREADEQRGLAVIQRTEADHQRGLATTTLGSFLQEQGGRELAAGQPARALPYLAAAYRMNPRSIPLRLLVADAMRSFDAEVQLLAGHTGDVSLAAFSPDGTRVATGGDDGAAKVWDARTGKLIFSVAAAQDDTPLLVAFHPTQPRLVTASHEGARIWDTADGALVADLIDDDDDHDGDHDRGVGLAALTADGRLLVVADLGGGLNVWDVATGKLRTRVPAPSDGLEAEALAISPDGALCFVSTNPEGNAPIGRVWDLETRKIVATLKGHGGAVTHAEFSHDSKRVLTASADSAAVVWEARGGKVITVFEGHGQELVTASFSANDQRVLTASRDGRAKIWDVERQMLLGTLEGHIGPIESARFSPDGRTVLTSSADDTARLFDAFSGEPQLSLYGHLGTVHTAIFSPDGFQVLTASNDGTARIWDTSARAVRLGDAALVRLGDAGEDADFSPDGKRVVATDHGKLHVFDAASGKLVVSLEHPKDVFTYAFSKDGLITTGCLDGIARVWDAATGKLLLSRGASKGAVVARFTPDGRRLVTSGSEGTQIFELSTGDLVHTFAQAVRSADFSPDGSRMLTTDRDHQAVLWDAASGKVLVSAGRHIAWALDGAFSPIGHRFITLGWEAGTSIWDSKDGKLLFTLSGKNLRRAEWAADGKRIVTADSAGRVQIWDGMNGSLLLGLEGLVGAQYTNFNPDRTLVVTASEGRMTSLWDAETGRRILALGKHNEPRFSPDGKRLLVFWDRLEIWNLRLETRSPNQIDEVVRRRVPWHLVKGQLLAN